MKPLITLLLSLPMLAACSTQPPASDTTMHILPEAGPVAVRWLDPSAFTEARVNRSELPRHRAHWAQQLGQYLHAEASRQLPAGQTLQVDILDVRRAGDYERSLGLEYQHVRVLRDTDPPRITLRFVLRDAQGKVLAEGVDRLSDIDYLRGQVGIGSDPLRYEKRLLRDWTANRLRSAP